MNAGVVLSFAGPGGTITAFVFVGLVTIAFMECLSEMISIWPIRNAICEFVGVFIDKDFGIVVGITYW